MALNGWGAGYLPDNVHDQSYGYTGSDIPYMDYSGFEQGYPGLDPQIDYLNPDIWEQMGDGMLGSGLNLAQQSELMQSLETTGVGDIEMMIEASDRLFNPQK